MHFSRECRIRKSSEFVRLRSSGKWIPGRFFHLQVCERNEGEAPSRLGLVVSRRAGSAVTRNLIKRRFREIFRAVSADLSPSIDVVVIARKGVDQISFLTLKQEFDHRLAPWRTVPDSN